MNDEKHTPNEDWEMSVSNVSPPEPNAENGDGWKMPEPIFRVSEGAKINRSEMSARAAENVSTEDLAGEDEAFVQEQPQLSDDSATAEATALPAQVEPAAAAAQSERGNTKWVVLLGGIFVFFAVLVIIMLGVYFLFWRN